MPFGMKNAPATFQRMVNNQLQGLEKYAVAYLDGIAIFSSSGMNHLQLLQEKLRRIHQSGLTIKPGKCQMGMIEVHYLGHWDSLELQIYAPTSFMSLATAHRNTRTNLCKWCDNSHPACEGGICYTNCSLSSYCETAEEICVTIWKQHNDSVQVTTLCHHPPAALENILLPRYNTARRWRPSPNSSLSVAAWRSRSATTKLIFYNQSDGYSLLPQPGGPLPVAMPSGLRPPFPDGDSVTVLLIPLPYPSAEEEAEVMAQEGAAYCKRHITQPEAWTAVRDQLGILCLGCPPPRCNISTPLRQQHNHNTELLPIRSTTA
ncbi:unnamed protein product [Ranitomeya imitator]|uniref:ribonuclease H n=1 Tax=Ranitomeya imitator TaxID=111125 RepID=A0ABN9KMZ9_9NEOB|nr:unnamed protein product [Ranitomeya imitator]